jgi:sulfite reductase (NADPH) hemoprotein beta-component
VYQYQPQDRQLVLDRVTQFKDQTDRYLSGQLTEEAFRPLRLQNGLYLQRQAPMLRVAVPYGLLNSTQLRQLASISRRYDRGYAHVSTRQNFQLNWPTLESVPAILAELAEVDMHCIQTSGNCIRNTTTDALAGVAADELIDPRPVCELIRQWSTLHPEFAYLPRKFKIAVSGSRQDRAAIYAHDVGIALCEREGALGFRVLVGGGLGRTPVIGSELEPWLPIRHLISYLEAILRVYNALGRRDNKYKARIKILLRAMGMEAFRAAVMREWSSLRDGEHTITDEELARLGVHFSPPPYKKNLTRDDLPGDPLFQRWLELNTHAHKQQGYRAVTVVLKGHGYAPGDITADQMEWLAGLADDFSFGQLRTTHEQNIVLADVEEQHLHSLWKALQARGLAKSYAGMLTDLISCPGGDFCSLANARSLPVAAAIHQRFEDADYLYDLGPIDLNISGCMNACGHHHIGHIGILGVDKKGEEFFQVSVGGRQGNSAKIGTILGPSFSASEIPEVIQKLLETYLKHRQPEELFIETCDRIGIAPFKEAVYVF